MGRRVDMPITSEQWADLDKKAKVANQRLASMKAGQREAVSYYRTEKFSRARPTSVNEYERRLKEVEDFLGSKQTTRRGWDEIKKTAVRNANKTLTKRRKYDLTDEELSNIFREVETKNKKELYRILDIVQAKKSEKIMEGSKFTKDELQEAINTAFIEHITAGEAIREKTAARKRAGIQSKRSQDMRQPKKRARRRPQK